MGLDGGLFDIVFNDYSMKEEMTDAIRGYEFKGDFIKRGKSEEELRVVLDELEELEGLTLAVCPDEYAEVLQKMIASIKNKLAC